MIKVEFVTWVERGTLTLNNSWFSNDFLRAEYNFGNCKKDFILSRLCNFFKAFPLPYPCNTLASHYGKTAITPSSSSIKQNYKVKLQRTLYP